MNDLDPRISVRVRTRAEFTDAQYKAFTDALSAAALDDVVEVKVIEIKPEPKPLIEVPEELKDKLGDLSFADYEASLIKAGHDKSFITKGWNHLLGLRVVKVISVDDSDESGYVRATPTVRFKPRDYDKAWYPGGEEEIRVASLSDRKKQRVPWELTSEQVRQAGHFIDLNELAAVIEANLRPSGTGSITMSVWAGLVNERVKNLKQLETEGKL